MLFAASTVHVLCAMHHAKHWTCLSPLSFPEEDGLVTSTLYGLKEYLDKHIVSSEK